MKHRRLNQKGFTVIELLVATMVFAVVLLLVSYAIIGLTRQFYRGMHQAKTQEVARNITEEIAKNIQYSKVSPINLAPGAWCISERTYTAVQGRRLGDVPAVLIRSNGCTTPPVGPGQVELIGENMRLSNLTITSDSTGNVWTVQVKVSSGADEQLENPNAANARCRTESGQQFCAVAEYSVVVVRRM